MAAAQGRPGQGRVGSDDNASAFHANDVCEELQHVRVPFMSPRPEAPPGRYALEEGARLVARIGCGKYGEETCRCWRLPSGQVVLEWSEARRRVLIASDELVVTGDGFVASNMVGLESELHLISDGKDELLTFFEMNLAWGGTSAEEAVAFARAIAAEVGCKVSVLPLVITDTRGASTSS